MQTILKNLFWKSKGIAIVLWVALVLNLGCWGGMSWLAKQDQPRLILHYNAFLGIDLFNQVDQGYNYWEVFFGPLGGAVIWVFNLFLIFILSWQTGIFNGKEKENGSGVTNVGKAGVYALVGAGLVTQLTVGIYVLAIVMVNIF